VLWLVVEAFPDRRLWKGLIENYELEIFAIREQAKNGARSQVEDCVIFFYTIMYGVRMR